MSGGVTVVMCRRRRLWSLMMVAVVVMSCCVSAAGKGTSPKRSPAASTGPPRKKKGTSTTKKTSKKKMPSSSSSKRRAYDEDEDDEDDTYESAVEPYYRPRRKRPAGPTMWQRGMVMAQKAAQQAVVSGKQAAERAKVLGAEAAVKAQEASRLAKAYYSSEYEKFLLTATWPSDQRIPPHLTKRLVESVARFPARPHSLPEDDPYRVTLRKLWKKMVEKDWRTSLKSLTLIHALSRQTPLKNSRALSRVLKSMLGDADPKTGRKYFNRRDLVSLKKDLRVAKLVDDYNGLVLRRALLFAGKLEDVSPRKMVCDASPRRSVADASKRAGNALLVLDHAVQFCNTAIGAGTGRGGSPSSATKVSETHLVVVGCLELVVADINDALALATDQLKPLAALNVTVDDNVGKTAAADAARALQKYQAILPKLQKATKMALKTLRFFDLKAHADLKVNIPQLQDAIDKWNEIAAESPEEEEEEDEDEDDEEDEEDDDDEDDDDDLDDDDDEDDLKEDEEEYEDEEEEEEDDYEEDD